MNERMSKAAYNTCIHKGVSIPLQFFTCIVSVNLRTHSATSIREASSARPEKMRLSLNSEEDERRLSA